VLPWFPLHFKEKVNPGLERWGDRNLFLSQSQTTLFPVERSQALFRMKELIISGNIYAEIGKPTESHAGCS
jgi:hypothetical protein